MRRGWTLLVPALAPVVASCSPPAAGIVDPGPATPVVEQLAEQEVLTPLPLRVRLPASYGAQALLVFFHSWGSYGWGSLELARHGQTWTGEVSCREVSTITGDTHYFFVALDGVGQVVAQSGSADWPHVATIVRHLPDGPRGLSGQAAPSRCHDPADCPPDFAGCPEYAWRRPVCRRDRDCPVGKRCEWDGYCSPDLGDEAGAPPDADDDALLAMAVRRALHRYRDGRRGVP